MLYLYHWDTVIEANSTFKSPFLMLYLQEIHHTRICKKVSAYRNKGKRLKEQETRDDSTQLILAVREFWVLLPKCTRLLSMLWLFASLLLTFFYSVGVLLPTPKGIERAIMLYKKKKNVSLATELGRGKLSATALALVTSICTIL